MKIFLLTLCVLSTLVVEVNAGCLGRSRRVERRAARTSVSAYNSARAFSFFSFRASAHY